MNTNHQGDRKSSSRTPSQDGQSCAREASGSSSGDRAQQWQGQSRSGTESDMSQSDRSWSSKGSKSSRGADSQR